MVSKYASKLLSVSHGERDGVLPRTLGSLSVPVAPFLDAK